MRAIALLAPLTLLSGCAFLLDWDFEYREGGSDAAVDTAAQCSPACREDQVCSPTGECVECLSGSDCVDTPTKPVCAAGACVQCVTASRDCTGTAPRCENNQCVACESSSDCMDRMGTPVCGPAGACVECTTNLDCPATEGRCDTMTNTCADCTSSLDCMGRPGAEECNSSGDCVQCTPPTEMVRCGTSATCNAFTFACTGAAPGTKTTCQRCVADSECTAGHFCVRTEFMGAPRPEENGYCLPAMVGACPMNLYTQMISRETVSGVTGVVVCGPDETRTTCEAVRDYLDNRACESGDAGATDMCGADGLDDAVCIPTMNLCSLRCSTGRQCPTGGTCNPTGSYCDP